MKATVQAAKVAKAEQRDTDVTKGRKPWLTPLGKGYLYTHYIYLDVQLTNC